MIRKTIIVMLTLGAASTTVVGIKSFRTTIRSDFWQIGDSSFCMHFRDSLARVVWVRPIPDHVRWVMASFGDFEVFAPTYDSINMQACTTCFGLENRDRLRKAGVSLHGIKKRVVPGLFGKPNANMTITILRTCQYTRSWYSFTRRLNP